MGTRLGYWLIIGSILAMSILLRHVDPGVLARTRLLGFDTLQQLMPRIADPSYPVRIVDIDERSLREVGAWPWRRDRLAILTERLLNHGASVVAFDMVFPATGNDPLAEIRERLRSDPELQPLIDKLASVRSPDERFADAIRGHPVVLGVIAKAGASEPASPRASFSTIGDVAGFVPSYSGVTSSDPRLENAATGIGAMNWFPERDQILRRVPMLVGVGDELYPSLVAETMRLHSGGKSIAVRAASGGGSGIFSRETGIETVRIGNTIVPTDGSGQMWMSFTGHDARRTISAADILSGRIAESEITGRIFVVGTSAPGLLDLRATPLDAVIAGVEINAQAIEQILSRSFLVRPGYSTGMEILAATLSAAMLAFLVARNGAAAAAVVGGLTVVALLAGTWIAYARLSLLFDAVFPIITSTATYIFGTGFLYYQTERERNRNRQVLAAISKEMEAAAEIQRSFLPRQELEPARPNDVSVFAIMRPAKHVGGDFYDYFMIDDDRLGFAIGDVSGKGVSAALFMSVSRTVLRTIAFDGTPPGEALTRVNEILVRENSEGMFVTLFYATLDLRTGDAEFSSAGHDDVHLLRVSISTEQLSYMGPAIGLIEGIEYPTGKRRLDPGDVMLLVTDGITEAFGTKGQQFGSDRLKAVLATDASRSAQGVVEAITREVAIFAKGAEQSDDITCLAVQYRGSGPYR